uniref:At1g61320/AtMIF1 LRR domain-containing protein n=1 Tax=Oryza meridionalis TaxID=40149 RepID=A0A0E0BYL8_9ORYZ
MGCAAVVLLEFFEVLRILFYLKSILSKIKWNMKLKFIGEGPAALCKMTTRYPSRWLNRIDVQTGNHMNISKCDCVKFVLPFKLKWQIWIELEDPRPLQGSFSKLTVLNLVGISDGQYELLWMIFFLQAAPFLQNLNLTIQKDMRSRHGRQQETPYCETTCSEFKHKHLKSLKIAGFKVEEKYMEFVRMVMELAMALQTIILTDEESCNYYRPTPTGSRMFKKDDVGYAPEQLPPPGVKRPMCWCGDECCFHISHDWDSYGQRYWMCCNYSYSPEKPKPVPKGRKRKAKILVKEPEIPPPLCDFVEWIDKEMTNFHKSMIQSWHECQEEREEWQRQRAAKEKAERERREELELRELARKNREKEERAEDRARKLARAQRAKDAGSEAARKGKYPRCTQ